MRVPPKVTSKHGGIFKSARSVARVKIARVSVSVISCRIDECTINSACAIGKTKHFGEEDRERERNTCVRSVVGQRRTARTGYRLEKDRATV